jgi:NAD(P)-dependent dehydrogenase (short-subunit alcohol dehydrogenase family)
LKLFDLSGRVAVVIGATSGLGRAIAVGLAQQGATVVPSGRRKQELECLCSELGSKVCLACDVTSRESVDVLRDAVLQALDRVDILVNAAGFTFRQATAGVTEQQWSSMMDINLTGVLRACQSFYEPLKKSGHGRILNIASLGSFLAFHGVAAYCASKTAVVSLTRSLACEWARDGICVNAIVPGIFPTEINREMILGTPRGKELLTRTPMGRFGKPEELTGAAVLLVSDAASFITGQCLVVDGGYLASGVNS